MDVQGVVMADNDVISITESRLKDFKIFCQ